MKKQAAALAILSALSAPALAAGPWYVYGAVGQGKFDLDKGAVDEKIRGITGVQPASTLDDWRMMSALQLGYRFTPHLAAEAGYYDLGKATYHGHFPDGSVADEDIKATGWGLSALGLLPLANRFSGFLRLGMIDAKVEQSAAIAGLAGSATQWKRMYGVGGLYDLNDAFTIRAEYQRFSRLGDRDKTGEIDVTAFSLGLMYRF
jgi:opacity protein-like surface antigen